MGETVIDENDDRFREEPWTKLDQRAMRILELKEEVADLKAERIEWMHLIEDLNYCRFHPCDNDCQYFHPGDDCTCGLDLAGRMRSIHEEYYERG